ncbi:hypothetical protein PQX77_013467 [Marasmius sp. AFHP31]|nr:hypothetical protein PQX77_013467 [Marasmius sp. AFHP31]
MPLPISTPSQIQPLSCDASSRDECVGKSQSNIRARNQGTVRYTTIPIRETHDDLTTHILVGLQARQLAEENILLEEMDIRCAIPHSEPNMANLTVGSFRPMAEDPPGQIHPQLVIDTA